jgi:Mor family transcriptional regulator
MLRTGRDASIIRLAEQDGVAVDELARMFGLSRRTIFRVLRTATGGGCRRGQGPPSQRARR